MKTFSRFKNSLIQTISLFGKFNSLVLDIFNLFKPKQKPSSIGKKWTRPELKEGTQPIKSKQLSSPQASINERDLVQDQILKPTSGNNHSDAT